MSPIYKSFLMAFLAATFMFAKTGYAQEIENSADVFLEEYSDEFQEAFFEGIKQKSIENHDRAVNSFLVCQKLEPNNPAVANELAKAYIENKQYPLAQEQAELALKENPGNMWYLQSLYISLKKQYKNVDDLKEIVPYDNNTLKENLAHILYLENNYNEAQNIVDDLKDSPFKTDINAKLQAANAQRSTRSFSFSTSGSTAKPTKTTTNSTQATTTSRNSNSAYNYKSRLQFIVKQKNYVFLESTAKEAIESYPSQPYFYYALGVAYNGKRKHRDAIETLKTALDYLLDDIRLGDDIYREIAAAYTAMGNPAKANMYLAKVKFKR